MFAKNLARLPAAPPGPIGDTRLPALDLNGPINLPFEAIPANWVDVPIIETLRQVAARHPERTAVRDRLASLDYRGLIAAVDRLAAAINRIPAQHGALGLLLPNSVHHPIAALACLAAGRAFAPFDLNYPPARIASLVQDAALDAVIVSGSASGDGPGSPPGLPRIDISACLDGPAAGPLDRAPLGPDSPAAILHTSGSSGRPKAVVISQASLLQRVLQHVNASHIGLSDQICPLSSSCTISGVREQLAALLTGATLHVVDPHRSSLSEIRRLIGDLRISVVYAVPALLRAIVQADGVAEDFASLRVVRLGGDAVLWRDISLLRQALAPTCHIQIGFSSTETPGMQWFVPPGFPADGAAAPLGYGMPGTRVEVVDEAGAPAPPGEVGELVIRSRFVALGLWQDGACVPGPFRADPSAEGVRANASGDLAWLRPDGLYAYAGRKDRQVKIRGQRVDATEVEATLRAVAGVLDAAVIAVTSSGEATLAAFVQARPDAQPEVLRAQAGQALRALPEVMRPPRLHVVPAIPRLPSAKPDIAALRDLDRKRRGNAASAPRVAAPGAGKIEAAVARAWREALGRQAGAGDPTWLEAGGDSLRLLEFALRLERRLGRELPLEMFDGDMRPHDVAAAIDRLLQSGLARDDGDLRPLVFFFPGIEGDTIAQARFRRSLREQARMEKVTYPDWQAMAGAGGGLDRFVDLACARILELPPGVPVRLVGYSFGAMPALALALRLAGQGRPVAWLAVLDADLERIVGSPTRAPWARASLAQRLRQVRAAGWKPAALQPLADLALDAMVRSALSWLTTREGAGPLPFQLPLPHRLPRQAQLRLQWTMRRDMVAAWFRGRELLAANVPVALFRTDDHPGAASLDLGWSAVGQPVRVHHVEGDHLTMLGPPHGAALAERFARTCLERDREAVVQGGP